MRSSNATVNTCAAPAGKKGTITMTTATRSGKNTPERSTENYTKISDPPGTQHRIKK